MKTKIAAIVGPTASGKTSLSIELAKSLNGEIISCDSMQIYKHMNIGTAKPTWDEMSGIPHRLIDFVEPDLDFSCADYSVLAKKCIDEISEKGKLPIFCGGTGLYVDHVLNNTVFSDAGKDDSYREKLKMLLAEKGEEYIHGLLSEVDPDSASKIHPNNSVRVIRALEIYHVTGKTKTEWDLESRSNDSPYDSRMICLDYRDRQVLYDRIDKRVDIMLEMGLVDEVKQLVSKYNLSKTALQGIGYKEIIDYLNGSCSFDEAVESIKKGTRNYAKRQLTWFRRYREAAVIYMDEFEKFDDIVNLAKNIIND